MHSKLPKSSQLSSSSLLLPPQVCVKNSLYKDPVSDTFSRLSSSHIFSSRPLSAAGQRNPQSPEQFALAQLLGQPISWSLATSLTMKSERTLRPRRVNGGSVEQRTRKGHLSGITKTWPGKHSGLKSKGMYNPRNLCYRRSVMQAFLHLPQFMQWIKHHWKDSAYPCRNANGLPSKKIKITPDCPACRMRRLIGLYWDKDSTQNEVPRTALRQFDLSLLHANNPDFPLSAGNQEDAGEFYRFLRDTFTSASNTQAWRNQSDALFEMDLRVHDVCGNTAQAGCGRRTQRPDPGFGLILPVEGNKDTINRAIERYFSPSTVEKHCDSCKSTVGHSSKALIESAPEILVLQLIIYHPNGRKKRTDVHFDRWLDLKRFQRDRTGNLKYKLSSVISHAGPSVKSGHYIVHVSGPEGFFVISDQDARKSTPSAFTAPKQRHPSYKTSFDPYLLTYTKTES